MYLSDAGCTIVPYMTSRGVSFIDHKYLLPFSDVDDSMLNLYERQAENGKTYFAVKLGFTLVGIIFPIEVINEKFVKRLNALAQQCEVTLMKKYPSDSADETQEQTDHQQMSFE